MPADRLKVLIYQNFGTQSNINEPPSIWERFGPVLPPRILGFVPNPASTTGDQWIQASGTGFQSGATVTVDGRSVPANILSDTLFEFRLGFQHSASPGTVMIINPDTQSTVAPLSFQGLELLRVTGVEINYTEINTNMPYVSSLEDPLNPEWPDHLLTNAAEDAFVKYGRSIVLQGFNLQPLIQESGPPGIFGATVTLDGTPIAESTIDQVCANPSVPAVYYWDPAWLGGEVSSQIKIYVPYAMVFDQLRIYNTTHELVAAIPRIDTAGITTTTAQITGYHLDLPIVAWSFVVSQDRFGPNEIFNGPLNDRITNRTATQIDTALDVPVAASYQYIYEYVIGFTDGDNHAYRVFYYHRPPAPWYASFGTPIFWDDFDPSYNTLQPHAPFAPGWPLNIALVTGRQGGNAVRTGDGASMLRIPAGLSDLDVNSLSAGYTLAAWVNRGGMPDGVTLATVLSTAAGTYVVLDAVIQPSGRFELRWSDSRPGSGGFSGVATSVATMPVNDGVFHHVVMRRNANYTVTFFIDGVVAGTNYTQLPQGTPTPVAEGDSYGAYVLGWPGAITGLQQSPVDNVALWGRALTDQEVADLMDAS